MVIQTDLDSVLSRVLLRLGNHQDIFSIFFRLKVEQKSSFFGYENLLEEVLFHLLSRAIRSAAASPGRKVKVLLRHNAQDNSVLLLVEDSGTMLPVSRSLPSPDVAFHKAGIRAGLYAAKHYVKLMNGRMGYKAKPGIGAMFKVRVPCPPVQSDLLGG